MFTLNRLFQITAIAEACSWIGLLVGMFFKYIVVGDDLGVKIFGPIHGALFVAYCGLVLLIARRDSWSLKTVALGLACAIPPLTSIWFERRMARTVKPAAVESELTHA